MVHSVMLCYYDCSGTELLLNCGHSTIYSTMFHVLLILYWVGTKVNRRNGAVLCVAVVLL